MSNESDPQNWKAGIFYFNRADPRVLVSKRFGIGGTLNFAKPATWLILGVLVAVLAGIFLLRH